MVKENYRKGEIISNENLAKNIYKMKVKGNFKGEPGQFYMLRGWEGLDPFLARPISINNMDGDIIEFLYEDRGRGTNLLSRLKSGDNLSLFGPLGNSFDKIEGENIAIVGGGIGIAPLVYLAKSLDVNIDFFCGFRDEVYEIENIKQYVDNVFVSTETGSVGHKGFITEIIDYDKYDTIITCGPLPMMEKLYEKKSELIISMEERMACGIGACMGCNIETINGNKKVCKDGPVFLAKEVFENVRN